MFVCGANGVWRQHGERLRAPEFPDGAGFGRPVAVLGDCAMVSAKFMDVEGAYQAGGVHVYRVFGPDSDGDGVIDACERTGKLDDDGAVNLADLATRMQAFGSPENMIRTAGDLDGDGDGDVDLTDLALLTVFGTDCP